MKSTNKNLLSAISVVAVLAVALSTPELSQAKEKDVPQTTKDGLELVNQTKQRVVYLAPDADISQYTKVSILDVYVAFKKNWQRDYNQQTMGLQGRVTDQDMANIKSRLAAEFKTIFTQELAKDGNHVVVDYTGADVLILRPAIINLDVTSPDLSQHQTGMTSTYTANAGQMTLYLELYDSVTSAKLAEVWDAQADRGMSTFSMSNRVTNKSSADRILRGWAKELASHLGAVPDVDVSGADSDDSGDDDSGS